MRTSSKVLVALACGAVAGALVGILFAPDKGSETRKKISEKANDLTSKLKKVKDQVGNKKPQHRTVVDHEVNEFVS